MKQLQKLARQHCASFTGSDGCLAEPNGQRRCQWFREDDQARPYIEDGSLRCFYFERHVLPIDPALEARYWNRDTVKCGRCGGSYSRTSNRQRFCLPCGVQARRERAREGMAKLRGVEKPNVNVWDV